MSQTHARGADASAHIDAVIAAHREADQPEATFRALDAALAATVGHKLFTILINHPGLQQNQRYYSNQPAKYPVGGSKPTSDFPLKQRLLVEGEPYIGRTAEDIRWAFFDHDLIFSLGCESVLNMPVRWRGQTLGSLNLLHQADWYSEADIPLTRLLAHLALPAIMLISRA